jgi:hypothetical protein
MFCYGMAVVVSFGWMRFVGLGSVDASYVLAVVIWFVGEG